MLILDVYQNVSAKVQNIFETTKCPRVPHTDTFKANSATLSVPNLFPDFFVTISATARNLQDRKRLYIMITIKKLHTS